MRSGVRGGECGKEAAAARFWRAEWRQSAVETRSPFFFEKTRNSMRSVQHFRAVRS